MVDTPIYPALHAEIRDLLDRLPVSVRDDVLDMSGATTLDDLRADRYETVRDRAMAHLQARLNRPAPPSALDAALFHRRLPSRGR